MSAGARWFSASALAERRAACCPAGGFAELLQNREAQHFRVPAGMRSPAVGSRGEVFWSDEMYRILGFDRATKSTLELLLQRIHPGDRAFVQATLDRASMDGTDLDIEHRLLMPEGSVKYNPSTPITALLTRRPAPMRARHHRQWLASTFRLLGSDVVAIPASCRPPVRRRYAGWCLIGRVHSSAGRRRRDVEFEANAPLCEALAIKRARWRAKRAATRAREQLHTVERSHDEKRGGLEEPPRRRKGAALRNRPEGDVS
jgi:hypothetical protein